MNGKRILVITIALLAMLVTSGWAATLEVTQPVQVTSDSYYERGQAIVYDGADYWLFYGRSATCTDPYSSGNPDINDYAIHYKKASTVAGLASASAVAVPGATSCYNGEIGAALVDGNVWTFATVPSVSFSGARSLYGWHTTDGSSWTQVADLWDNMANGAAHHDEVGFDGKLYIMANYPESYTGWYSKYTDDPTAGTITWSTPVPLNSTANLVNGTGHFYVEGSTLYIGILRTNPTRDNKVLEYVAPPGEAWTELCTAVSTGWDGTLFKVGSDYVYAQAPWVDPRQYIIAWTGATPATVLSGSPHMVSEAQYGSNGWVDMWPIGFTDSGGTSYLFYTSERDEPAAEGVGNIWYLEVDWTVTNDHYTYVQEAVNAAVGGDAIDVAAGTYTEQVHITSTMSLTGAGVGSTVIASPVTLTDYFMTGTNYNYPVVFVDGATGVALSDMTIDGDNQGDTNPRFVGVAFWNGGGSMTDMEVLNVMNSTFSGAQHGVGVYSYNDAGGPYTVAMTDVLVDDYQKTGVALLGDGMTVTLTRVTTVGQGATSVTAQNGIQTGYGSGGTITDCVVTGNAYTGDTWSASGILPYGGTMLSVDGFTLDGNQTSIYLQNNDGSFANGSVTNPTGDALYAMNTVAKGGGPVLESSPFDAGLAGRGVKATMTASFTNSTFTGTGATDSWGPSAYVYGGDVVFTVTGCTVTDWDWGVVAYEDGGTVTSHINGNSIYGNTSYGFFTNATAKATQDATGNWWGHVSGPHHDPLNLSGQGDPVSDGVDFDPWLTGNVVCVPDPLDLVVGSTTGTIDVDYLGGGGGLVYGYSVTVTWDVTKATFTGITEGNLLSDAGGTNFFAYGPNGSKTIDCALTGGSAGVTGPGTLFTLAFSAVGLGTSTVDLGLVAFRDNANAPLPGFYEDDGLIRVDILVPTIADVEIFNTTLMHTDHYIKDTDGARVKATVLDDDPTFDASNIVADLSGFIPSGGTAVNPGSYNWTTGEAIWTIVAPTGVICAPADGTVTVTVDATDPLGNPATPGSDVITSDNTLPGNVTGFAAAPAHQEGILSWTDPTSPSLDTNYYGIVVRYDAWGDYPVYGTTVPDYPGTPTAGDGEAFNDLGAVTGAVHAIEPRDIHYYSAFAYDWALNYGVGDAGGQDRCTNYWLGDVANVSNNWVPDGLVTGADINKLGTLYGGAPSGDELKCDVGPTDDHSRVGIPEPEGMLNFEDLMIFAMNYGVVSAKVVPFLGEPGVGDLALALVENGRSDGVLELALRLEGNAGDVKGLTAELEFEGLEFLSARLSDDMSSPVADMFFWSDATSRGVQVDAAVLGTDVTIGGSGDVALFTFQVLDETYSVDFASATLRGAANEDLTAELEGLSSDGVPVAFKLVQNSPNPFNPVTKVAYHVPSASRVTIRVFDVSGRLVTTLVDGVVEPGRHAAVWDGTNDRGESVGSGVYFCTMETPDYSSSNKMTLLK